MRNKLQVVFGFLVTGVLLYLAFRDVDLGEVFGRFAAANLWLVAPAVACSFVGYLLRARRWQSLLAPERRIPFSTLFSILIIGFAANNVLPARVGELIRAHQIGRKENISRSMCFSTIVVERVCDGFTLLAFMGIVLWFTPFAGKQPEIQAVETFSSLIFLAAGAVILLLLFQGDRVLRIVTRLLSPLPTRVATRLLNLADSLLMGLRALKSARHLTAILGLSVVIWSLEAGSYFLVLLALNVPLELEQRVAASFFLVVFVNLGIMIPSAPGYVGTFQLFAKLALGAFGVASAPALSVALLAHAQQYLLVTGLGLVFFLKEQGVFNRFSFASPAPVEPRLSDPTPE